MWLDVGSRSIDQCWSQTCVPGKISQGAFRKMHISGPGCNARKIQDGTQESLLLKAPWGIPIWTLVGNY